MTEQLAFEAFDPPPPPTDRLFFAVFPDAEAAAQTAALAAQIRTERGIRNKALAEDRFHITLYHLGDYPGLPEPVLEAAYAAAGTVRTEPFEVTLDRVVSFKGRPGNRPLVLTGGDGVVALRAFHAALGSSMMKTELGRRVRPQFNPHLTLLYSGHEVAEQATTPVRWMAKEFVLVHSELGLIRHNILRRWPLAG
jgi:RNA 2',3'-cyclic 3'-phosphodiesterase